MSSSPINLDAFWRAPYSERALLLKHLLFIHDKKTQLEKEKLNIINTLPPVAAPAPPLFTPTKSSNVNPPPPPRKEKRTARMSAPPAPDDYEIFIHKVSFDSEDEDAEDGFIIHKKKKTNPSLNLNEK